MANETFDAKKLIITSKKEQLINYEGIWPFDNLKLGTFWTTLQQGGQTNDLRINVYYLYSPSSGNPRGISFRCTITSETDVGIETFLVTAPKVDASVPPGLNIYQFSTTTASTNNLSITIDHAELIIHDQQTDVYYYPTYGGDLPIELDIEYNPGVYLRNKTSTITQLKTLTNNVESLTKSITDIDPKKIDQQLNDLKAFEDKLGDYTKLVDPIKFTTTLYTTLQTFADTTDKRIKEANGNILVNTNSIKQIDIAAVKAVINSFYSLKKEIGMTTTLQDPIQFNQTLAITLQDFATKINTKLNSEYEKVDTLTVYLDVYHTQLGELNDMSQIKFPVKYQNLSQYLPTLANYVSKISGGTVDHDDVAKMKLIIGEISNYKEIKKPISFKNLSEYLLALSNSIGSSVSETRIQKLEKEVFGDSKVITGYFAYKNINDFLYNIDQYLVTVSNNDSILFVKYNNLEVSLNNFNVSFDSWKRVTDDRLTMIESYDSELTRASINDRIMELERQVNTVLYPTIGTLNNDKIPDIEKRLKNLEGQKNDYESRFSTIERTVSSMNTALINMATVLLNFEDRVKNITTDMNKIKEQVNVNTLGIATNKQNIDKISNDFNNFKVKILSLETKQIENTDDISNNFNEYSTFVKRYENKAIEVDGHIETTNEMIKRLLTEVEDGKVTDEKILLLIQTLMDDVSSKWEEMLALIGMNPGSNYLAKYAFCSVLGRFSTWGVFPLFGRYKVVKCDCKIAREFSSTIYNVQYPRVDLLIHDFRTDAYLVITLFNDEKDENEMLKRANFNLQTEYNEIDVKVQIWRHTGKKINKNFQSSFNGLRNTINKSVKSSNYVLTKLSERDIIDQDDITVHNVSYYGDYMRSIVQ